MYKAILKTDQPTCELIGDASLKTYEEIIQEYSVKRQEAAHASAVHASHASVKNKQQPNLCNSAYEALGALHGNLQSYWEQFGILDKSTQGTFRTWAKNNLTFKECRTRSELTE